MIVPRDQTRCLPLRGHRLSQITWRRRVGSCDRQEFYSARRSLREKFELPELLLTLGVRGPRGEKFCIDIQDIRCHRGSRQ